MAKTTAGMRSGEICCDVRELPPPEPMSAVLEALPDLQQGEYLRMMHRMEPVPLYSVLNEMGFQHSLYLEGEAPYEIMIFRKGDAVAQARVETHCAGG
jgi:uncharacterized protein (DUF2249 family)